MSSVLADDFEDFFRELHQRGPFPWQIRLAKTVCGGDWPKVIDLPTASGKTACIEIALFALAVRGKEAPRRIFFVVDRRLIVNAAAQRARGISQKLKGAAGGVVKRVADELRAIGGTDQPLDVYELRGGSFRDETWVRTPLQPTVVTSTVDQVGSRLLFRGYGIGEHTWPIHAGLIANDALLFLDEAHCSKAFGQTLEAVESYRSKVWAPGMVGRPFHFVEMTATPSRTVPDHAVFRIDEEDRSNEVFARRLNAVKTVRLPEPVRCKKEETGKFADALITQSRALANEVDGKRVAILVNRIATARAVHRQLRKSDENAVLVIGRMRAFDREKQAEQLEPFATDRPRTEEDARRFVVATQCLEVGADLDFDVVVSECASLDALQQRFGRLDRTGRFGQARGAILIASWQLSAKDRDPVYGEALKKTWEFLGTAPVNMGIEAAPGECETVAQRLGRAERNDLALQTQSAPKLLPSHLDALVQTSPTPVPEPDVELFLHGPKKGNPDVYVIWRRDLNGLEARLWRDVVGVCPPTSREAMPTPLWSFRKWFNGEPLVDESDIEVAEDAEDRESGEAPERAVLIWRDEGRRELATQASDIQAGDVVVLSESVGDWDRLGFVPEGHAIDIGDQARLAVRRRITLRLHPEVMKEWRIPTELRDEIDGELKGQEVDEERVREALLRVPEDARPLDFSGLPEMSWEDFVKSATLSRYPGVAGWVLESFYGRKEKSKSKAVSLRSHTDGVVRAIEMMVGDLVGEEIKTALTAAAEYHDYGKVDVRFQAWLRNGDRKAAEFAPRPIAKSGQVVLKGQRECGLPEGFRHELLSLLFAQNSMEGNAGARDLVLHLIASHHGYCRPFAPVSIDPEAECVAFESARVCRKERLEQAAHALGSGVADRFWRLTRRYGWWGLAYLEAMLRLADWQASDETKSEVMG